MFTRLILMWYTSGKLIQHVSTNMTSELLINNYYCKSSTHALKCIVNFSLNIFITFWITYICPLPFFYSKKYILYSLIGKIINSLQSVLNFSKHSLRSLISTNVLHPLFALLSTAMKMWRRASSCRCLEEPRRLSYRRGERISGEIK